MNFYKTINKDVVFNDITQMYNMLLMDINSINEIIDINNKVILLKLLGFINIPEVRNTKLPYKKYNDEQSKYVKVLKERYPNNKILHISDINIILEKYNLDFVDVNFYKENIPFKNTIDITTFKLYQEDYRYYKKYNNGQVEYLSSKYYELIDNNYGIEKEKFKICTSSKNILGSRNYFWKKTVDCNIVLQQVHSNFYIVITEW